MAEIGTTTGPYCRRLRGATMTVVFGLAAVTGAAPSPGQDRPHSRQPSVAETWESMPPVPWYHPETGQLTVVPFRVRDEPPAPEASKLQRVSPPGTVTGEPSRQPRSVGTWISQLGILVLVLLLARTIVRTLRQPAHPPPIDPKVSTGRTGTAATVERRPLDLQTNAADYLAESRQAASRGQFGEATAFLFAHTLTMLNRKHLISWEAGKTNGEYVRELQPHAALQQAFEHIRRAFEDYYFGGHPVDGPRYEMCRHHLEAVLADELPGRSP